VYFGTLYPSRQVSGSASRVATLDTTTPTELDKEIGPIERVPLTARNLPGVYGREADPSPQVFGVRHRLQVIGVDARPVAAKVVDDQPFRDWAN